MAKSTKTSGNLPFQRVAIDAQRRSIEMQRKTLGRLFDTVSGLQERNEDAWLRFIDGMNFVPEEAKTLQQTWVELSRSGREEFRGAMTQTFDLMSQYTDRVDTQASK